MASIGGTITHSPNTSGSDICWVLFHSSDINPIHQLFCQLPLSGLRGDCSFGGSEYWFILAPHRLLTKFWLDFSSCPPPTSMFLELHTSLKPFSFFQLICSSPPFLFVRIQGGFVPATFLCKLYIRQCCFTYVDMHRIFLTIYLLSEKKKEKKESLAMPSRKHSRSLSPYSHLTAFLWS